MSLNRYVRQLKPIQNNKVNYVQQVQEAVEKLPQEKLDKVFEKPSFGKDTKDKKYERFSKLKV